MAGEKSSALRSHILSTPETIQRTSSIDLSTDTEPLGKGRREVDSIQDDGGEPSTQEPKNLTVPETRSELKATGNDAVQPEEIA